ncbi:hypothetical protein [Xanthomonas bonasiae]|uniref:hypothetical protein n=1 Tax=Xanthomonas bonasiae TaxID=2810351 RepID=UPI001CD8232F|nr:hypothetical protein [Xanthomonas surreyensis]
MAAIAACFDRRTPRTSPRAAVLTCLPTVAASSLVQLATISGCVYRERDGHVGRGTGERGVAGVQVSTACTSCGPMRRAAMAHGGAGCAVFVIESDGCAAGLMPLDNDHGDP